MESRDLKKLFPSSSSSLLVLLVVVDAAGCGAGKHLKDPRKAQSFTADEIVQHVCRDTV